jgi:hypothetical protein
VHRSFSSEEGTSFSEEAVKRWENLRGVGAVEALSSVET